MRALDARFVSPICAVLLGMLAMQTGSSARHIDGDSVVGGCVSGECYTHYTFVPIDCSMVAPGCTDFIPWVRVNEVPGGPVFHTVASNFWTCHGSAQCEEYVGFLTEDCKPVVWAARAAGPTTSKEPSKSEMPNTSGAE